jgi:hypothetical protein
MTAATEISAALPNGARALARIEALDWQEIGKNLDEQGNAALAGILTPQECEALAGLYANDDASGAASSWNDMDSIEVNTNISATRYRTSSKGCAQSFTAGLLRWRTDGTSQ